MRRVVLAIVAVGLAFSGLWIQPIGLVAETAAVPIYNYDVHHDSDATAPATTERGPPAWHDRDTVHFGKTASKRSKHRPWE